VRLLYAELLKIRTAPRTTLGLVLGLLLLVGVGSAATASSGDSSPFAPETETFDVIRVTSIAAIFTLILGILVVTWEYRHGTITQTFLATPRRERVIGAKLGASFVVGGVLTAVAIALALAAAAFWISLDFQRDQWELAGRMVLAAALWGVFGAGLGAVLQSQVGAIVTSFVWFLVAEPLLGATLDLLTDASIEDYFPGSVLDRLQQTDAGIEIGANEIVTGPDYPYGLWAAALLATAYALAFAVLGIISAVRRDVP
jgi:ABC-type transport system involved in multi-copper enzyme maturation permease subunit